MFEPVIVSAVRTPLGTFNGSLASLPATRLGAVVLAEAVKRAGISGEEVEEAIMGNILSAGLGQAPARQAVLFAGLPQTVGAVTINKVCGSGLKAVMLAAQAIKAGDAKIMAAGGMESMSNAPYLLSKARQGYRMGHGELIDSMIKDGLWDVYNDFHMGNAAELCAEIFKISREEQDQYAITSYQRAIKSAERGDFKPETVPVTVAQKGKETIVQEDEALKKVDFEKLKSLKPAFKEKGSITAANASSISDGASAVVIMERETARKKGLTPLARVIGYATSAAEPVWFTTAPVLAIERLLQLTGFRIAEIDLFEINEAFSASSIAVNRKLGLDPEKVNVRGGAVALGHPIGASGARILTTLLYSLKSLGKKRGIASLCLGGGEAVAMMVENVSL
ncbi:MAG: thiolase family protein [Nitrospirae bacterium]|nr:thiolase family protein [Nitrospirota bacterium]